MSIGPFRNLRKLLAVAAVLLVAACSSGKEVTPSPPPSRGGSQGPPSTTAAPPTTAPQAAGAVTLPLPPPVDYGVYSDHITFGGRTHVGSVEYSNFIAECLTEQTGGYFEVTEDGGIYSTIGRDFSIEWNDCRSRAVESGLIGVNTYSEETLRLWYRAYTEVAYPCLLENDHPTNPPPSMDAWVDNFPDVWLPHEILNGVDPTLVATLDNACSEDIVVLMVELGRRDREAGVAP